MTRRPVWRVLRNLLRTILGRIYDLLPAPREEVVEAVNEVLDQIEERRAEIRDELKDLKQESRRLEAAEKALRELGGEPEEDEEEEPEEEEDEGSEVVRRPPARPTGDNS